MGKRVGKRQGKRQQRLYEMEMRLKRIDEMIASFLKQRLKSKDIREFEHFNTLLNLWVQKKTALEEKIDDFKHERKVFVLETVRIPMGVGS